MGLILLLLFLQLFLFQFYLKIPRIPKYYPLIEKYIAFDIALQLNRNVSNTTILNFCRSLNLNCTWNNTFVIVESERFKVIVNRSSIS